MTKRKHRKTLDSPSNQSLRLSLSSQQRKGVSVRITAGIRCLCDIGALRTKPSSACRSRMTFDIESCFLWRGSRCLRDRANGEICSVILALMGNTEFASVFRICVFEEQKGTTLYMQGAYHVRAILFIHCLFRWRNVYCVFYLD